tara:strand:+ start:2332 stop:3033 length:702 start_codon:yes stop_codon:yes gene_type:complete
MKKQQVKETRQFLGIWIPREIYLNQKLNWTDKILVVEINSLDNERGCFASNEYFAEFLSVSTTTISTSISKLKSLNLIEQVSFDGRTRILKAAFKQIKNPPLNKVKGSRKENLKHNKTNNKTINISNIEIRKLKFINDISLINKNKETSKQFESYWTEENSNKTKMRFEMEKIFDIKKRFARWESNELKWNKKTTEGKSYYLKKKGVNKTKQNINTWQDARTMLDNLNLPNGN